MSLGPVSQSQLTIGKPIDIASINTSGNPSNLDDKTYNDAFKYSDTISVTGSRIVTLSCKFSEVIIDLSSLSLEPLPIISNFQPKLTQLQSFHVCNNKSKPF